MMNHVLIRALCLAVLLPMSASAQSGRDPKPEVPDKEGKGVLQAWEPAADPGEFLKEVQPSWTVQQNYYDAALKKGLSDQMLSNAQAIMAIADPVPTPIRYGNKQNNVRYDDGHTLVAVSNGKEFVVCVQGPEGRLIRQADGSIGKDKTPMLSAAGEAGQPRFFGMSQTQLKLIRPAPDAMSKLDSGIVYGTKITVANRKESQEISRLMIGFQYPGKEPWDPLVQLTKDTEGKLRFHSPTDHIIPIKAAMLFWLSLKPDQLQKATQCSARR